MTLENEEMTQQVRSALDKASFTVSSVKKGERIRKAPLPFTTSTMQQEASRVLNFGTQKTMRIAQQLYEGVDIKGEGTVGLITYLRTDSTRISDEANASAAKFIESEYGKNYLGQAVKASAGNSARTEDAGNESGTARIQDAHEAIRPSDITRTPASVKNALSREQFRLYELIWKRFVGSRMASAKYETLQIRVTASSDKEYVFTAGTARVLSEGFQVVYKDPDNTEDKKSGALGTLEEVDYHSFEG